MLGVEFDGVAIGRDVGHQLVPPEIPARLHGDGAARAADNDHLLDRRRLRETFIDGGLEADLFPAPPTAVSRDDQFRLGIVVPIGDGVGTETAEDD